MDLRQLEILQAIADTGSFTACGRKLHVSQSAISRQIALLEEELGEPLFLRVGRRVRMTPAVFLGTAMAAIFSANLAGGLAVGGADLAWLFLFGAVNLGLGLALYVTGARLVPAAVATLVSTIEPVLAPVWVWLVHGEVPGGRTLLGGAIIFAALLFHFLAELRRQRTGLRP